MDKFFIALLVGLFLACPVLATTYTVTNCADSGYGSLRDAIITKNVFGSPINVIAFNVPSSDSGYTTEAGVSFWRIAPASALPDLSSGGFMIDGSTQTTNQGETNPYGPEIMIDGTNAGNVTATEAGFKITFQNTIIKNLIISNFSGRGVLIMGAGADNNQVVGCYIGTDASGEAARPNGLSGVALSDGADGNIIGGSLMGRNLISGNGADGVNIYSSCSNNKVSYNYIGPNRNGDPRIGNNQRGVAISLCSDNRIGPYNIISQNQSYGVRVADSPAARNTITQNSIHQNGQAGIKLDGGNNSLSFPTIESIMIDESAGQITVSGWALPSVTTVEIFAGDGPLYAYGDGRTYEAAATRSTAEATGAWSVVIASLITADCLTATATDYLGNTSQFSLNKELVSDSTTTTSITGTTTPTSIPTTTTTTTNITTTTKVIDNVEIDATSASITMHFSSALIGAAKIIIFDPVPPPRVVKEIDTTITIGQNTIVADALSSTGHVLAKGVYGYKMLVNNKVQQQGSLLVH